MGNWERKDEYYNSYYDKTMKNTNRRIAEYDHKLSTINAVMVGLVGVVSFCMAMTVL